MVIVTINGTDYYVPVDYADYIVQVGNSLTLSKSGSCTLYSQLGTYNNGNVAYYPQITLQFGRTGRYVTSSGYNTATSELVVNSYEVKQDIPFYEKRTFSPFLLVVIVGVLFWQLLKN